MTRTRKILTAGIVLLIGLMLSWPFRRTGSTSPCDQPPAIDHQLTPQNDLLTRNPSSPTVTSEIVPVAPQTVAARPASTSEPDHSVVSRAEADGFDRQYHPALVSGTSLPSPTASTTTDDSGSEARPTFPTLSQATGLQNSDDWPQEVLHIVRNGDTLERLAERYLDDPGRALEIFDLNRDQLSNPHLLPIGVELRIPAESDSSSR